MLNENNIIKSFHHYINNNETLKYIKSSFNNNKFIYNSLFVIIVHIFIFIISMIFNIDLFTINNLHIKIVGTLIGLFFSDVILCNTILHYNIYIQNITKYALVFIFQNIILKLLLDNYFVFEMINLMRINFYIFIYFLLDVLTNNSIHDDNTHKNLYMDLVKITFGFIVVESLIKKKLTKEDLLYVVVLSIAYMLFYLIIEKNYKFISSLKAEKII